MGIILCASLDHEEGYDSSVVQAQAQALHSLVAQIIIKYCAQSGRKGPLFFYKGQGLKKVVIPPFGWGVMIGP